MTLAVSGKREPMSQDPTSVVQAAGLQPQSPIVSVREILEHPCLVGSEVVAGRGGLDRSVLSTAVLDIDDPDSIQPGQLLLANAYSLLNADLLHLIPTIHQQRGVALGLKLSGYWKKVPDTLIRAANSYSIPLIVMPEGPFDDIMNPLLTMITERQLLRLRRTQMLHGELTTTALKERGDPSAIVGAIYRAIGKPVALFNGTGDLIAFEGNREIWNDDLMLSAIRAKRSGYLRFAEDHWLITQIPGTSFPGGVLCAHGVEPHESFGRAALAHAAIVIGMLQVERRQVEEVHRRFERDLLEDLVAGRLSSEDEARERAAWVGWPLHQSFQVVALFLPERSEVAESRELLLDRIESALEPLDLGVKTFRWGPALGIVAHLASREDATQAAKKIQQSVQRFVAEDGIPAEALKFGVADPREALTEVPVAFEEASLAVLLARGGHEDDRLSKFADLGLARLLCKSNDPEGLLRSARDRLGGLYPDRGFRNKELLETLAALLDCNMSVRTTAKRMYFHYNTVRHRLGKLRRVLGPLLDDPIGRLELSLAVAAIDLIQERDRIGPSGIRSPE